MSVMGKIYSIEQVQQALYLADFDGEAAQRKMIPRPRGVRLPNMPGKPRLGAVLIILYKKNGETHLVLTRRRDDLQAHPGQISFPGGRREGDETLAMTAVREAQEEIGVFPAHLNVLGQLESLYIGPSDFEVHPFVAWHDGQPRFIMQEEEVAEILEVSLAHLLNPENSYEEPWEIRGFTVQVPYFLVGEHQVWGATAMMLSELLERLRAGGSSR
jgi:8-oxo-dGTP pyrophosphatase MutT (NUDIX family)